MIEMILIPAAEFIMGITKQQAESAITEFYAPATEISPYQFYVEVPEHEVKVNSFLISKNEITNADFRQFIEGGGYENEDLWQELVQAKKINTDLPGFKRIQALVDMSGNPAPRGWKNSMFPSGMEHHVEEEEGEMFKKVKKALDKEEIESISEELARAKGIEMAVSATRRSSSGSGSSRSSGSRASARTSSSGTSKSTTAARKPQARSKTKKAGTKQKRSA